MKINGARSLVRWGLVRGKAVEKQASSEVMIAGAVTSLAKHRVGHKVRSDESLANLTATLEWPLQKPG